MNKFEIETKLNELKDCEILQFNLDGNITKYVHQEYLINNIETEYLISEFDNFKAPYCAIEDVCKAK